MPATRLAGSLTAHDVGHRVVVRYSLDGSGAPFTDALGTLTAAAERELTVDTRRGSVRIATAAVVAAKRVPERRAAR